MSAIADTKDMKHVHHYLLLLLLTMMGAACASPPAVTETKKNIEILPPEFSISSIKIKRAELINTKLEVKLSIVNPNEMVLELNALEYELFGDKRLWTDGVNSEKIIIPPQAKIEATIKMSMNFIGMKRGLLDQVIRLETVQYRFRGNAAIVAAGTGLPGIVFPFDIEDSTAVIE